MLEFDRQRVTSEDDLFQRVRTEEEVEVRVRGRDDDGNLSYLALLDEAGEVLYLGECSEQQDMQCTLVLKVVAPSDSGEDLEFWAVAVDDRDSRSETVRLSMETRRASSGGSSGSSSPPTATPTPAIPILSVEDGDVNDGDPPVSLDIVLSKAPDGLSGFSVVVTLNPPNHAEITGVEFFDDMAISLPVTLPDTTVTLAVADVNQLINNGATNITLATLQIDGINAGAGPEEVEITIDSYVLQDDNDGASFNASVVDGTLTVNP